MIDIKFNKNELEKIVQESNSLRTCAKKMGLAHHNTAKRILLRHNIDISCLTVNHVGKIFGMLTIIKIITKKNKTYAECLCTCGSLCIKRLDALIGGKYVGCSHLCTRKYNNTFLFGERNPAYKGKYGVPKSLFSEIRRNATRRNLKFDIDFEYIAKLAKEQQHRCVYTNILLEYTVRACPGTASLDRIDSTKGYIKGNVHWVH